MPKPLFKWRHAYDTERDEAEGLAAAIKCEDESLTQQHFTQDADLNVIAARFGLDGRAIPVGTPDPASFRDVSNAPDLRQILDLRNQAVDAFRTLPSKIRNRFHNDPRELWTFVNDPENSEEAVRLGLLKTLEEPEPEQPKRGTATPPEQPPK